MATQVSGTVIGGRLELDDPVSLPDHSRVVVVISPQLDERAKRMEAFAAWRSYIQEHPLNSRGERYSREELHERR